MQSLYSMLQTRKVFGEEIPLNYKPTYRSSAIFTVINEENLNTRILFMGYWLLKRGIQQIALLINLRDEKGNLVLRKHNDIVSSQAFRIEIKDLLSEIDKIDSKFIGSIELEIYSSVDLVYPYPAFVINYYNKTHCTSVHSVGRIYNDLEDLKDNDTYKVKESGFDIYSSQNLSGFFTFTNGAISSFDQAFQMEIENYKGEKLESTVTFDRLNPYETKFIEINDFFTDLDIFLNNKSGTIKIDHNLKGVFPRFIVGNLNKIKNEFNITHSYYDSSKINDENAYWNRLDENFLDSTIAIPLYYKNNLTTSLIIYPIFSPSKFNLSVSFFDKLGNKIIYLENIFESKEKNQEYSIIKLDELLFENNLLENDISSARIECNWNDKQKIPTRIKFGLNVGFKNNYPCNICFAPQLGNPSILNKKNTFKWSPILNHYDSEIVITNSSSLKNYDQIAEIEACFHREEDNMKLNRTYTINAFGIETIKVNKDNELMDFLNNKTGWVTFTSKNPNIYGWYFDFTESGIVAADHIF